MSKYAVIDQESNLVLNIIEWDGQVQYNPGPGRLLVNVDNTTAGIGHTYNPDNGSFHLDLPDTEEEQSLWSRLLGWVWPE